METCGGHGGAAVLHWLKRSSERAVVQALSGGVGNLGVLRRSGSRARRCSRNSAAQTTRNATTPATTMTLVAASAARTTSTTIVAASAASTVATIVGVLTRNWPDRRRRRPPVR